MKGLWDYCDPQSNYRPSLWVNMLSMTSSVCRKYEHQCSVNDLRACIMEYHRALRLLWSIIELSAAFRGKDDYEQIVTMSQHERQWSVNNVWSCILDNLMSKERREPTMNPSVAFIGKHAGHTITSASYNWAPGERQQSLWRPRTLHSNELRCAVPKSSFMQSVVAI